MPPVAQPTSESANADAIGKIVNPFFMSSFPFESSDASCGRHELEIIRGIPGVARPDHSSVALEYGLPVCDRASGFRKYRTMTVHCCGERIALLAYRYVSTIFRFFHLRLHLAHVRPVVHVVMSQYAASAILYAAKAATSVAGTASA
jgi:hypothetical protein